jgi:hypothetical protein
MLKAGIGRANINPPLDIPSGLWMAQKHIFAEGLHQDLWVTALAIADGDKQIVMLDFDLVMLSNVQEVAVRQAVADTTGIPPNKVFPFCTHNHAGPKTQDSYNGAGKDRVKSYIQSLPGLAAGAARAAWLNLTEVRVAAGRGHSEIGINRDLPLSSGRIVAGPNPDGVSDQEVGVIRFDRIDGSPYICILNYACHPTVLGPANKMISPDYPGSAKRAVELATGATCFFLQGAAGNMGPAEGFVGDVAVAEKLGKLLGLEAAKVFLSLNTSPTRKKLDSIIESGAPLTQYIDEAIDQPDQRLRILNQNVAIPVRNPLPDVYEKADERLARWQAALQAKLGIAGLDQERAEMSQKIERELLRLDRKKLYKAAAHMEIEMHVICIGEIALLTIWGEPYCEIGIEVKKRSPFANTIFACYLGSDPIYIGTPEMYLPQPPFEIENCPFAPEAAAVVVQSALQLLQQAKQEV